MAAAKKAAPAKAEPKREPVLTRPVLPEDPTHEQLATAISELGAWFAAVKTATRRHAITAQRGPSGRGGFCYEGLNEFLIEVGLPACQFSRYDYDTGGSITRDKAMEIPAPEPLVAAHYTEEGLRYQWDTLSREADEWLTRVRARAIRAYNQSYITLNRLRAYFRVTGQPAPHEVTAVVAAIHTTWNVEGSYETREADTALVEAAVATALADLGVSAVTVSISAQKSVQ